MKIRIIAVLILFLSIRGTAQTISVSSFKLLDTDLTANTAGTMEKDQNGETAALIKVVTTQNGFTFDGGALGVVKTKQTPGEVWVYIPRGAQKITIKHPQLGVLRDYYFPCSIESGRTYEMVLISGEVETIVKNNAQSQFLIIKVIPKNAIVELDNEILSTTDGIAQKFLKLGTYEYRIQAQSYHPEAGKVTIDNVLEKKTLEVKLKPAFGWLEVLESPSLKGASIYVDNAFIGIAPIKSGNINSGRHIVKIAKPLYKSYEEEVTIEDNLVTKISPSLTADFSTVTLKVDDNEAKIYINDEYKGTGSWEGNLGTGTYSFEARKKNHRSTMIQYDINASQSPQTIQLTKPTPIYGELKISSSPVMSDIYLDGKPMGQTPLYLPKLIIGEHKILLKHKNYSDYNSSFTVIENKLTEIDAKLDDRIDVKIVCNIQDATLILDGVMSGKANRVHKIGKGYHDVKIECKGYETYSSPIMISDKSPVLNVELKKKKNVEMITNLPSGGAFYVDGVFVGNVSERFFIIKPGIHKLKVSVEGYEDLEKEVEIDEIENTLLFELKSINNRQQKKSSKKKKDTKSSISSQTNNVSWESIKLTYNSDDIYGMVKVGDVTDKYGIGGAFSNLVESNRQRCLVRMKKNAAKMGGRVILIGTPYEVHPLGGNFMKVPGTVYK